MMTTTAETISSILGEDGRAFATPDGTSLDALCERQQARVVRQQDGVRYHFADGSAIVVAGGAWDLGIPGSSEECHCWLGADRGRHHEDCEDCDDAEVRS